MKYSFPAIFERDKDNSEFVNVTFPDLWGVVTFGKDLDNVRFMAKDVLKTMLKFEYIRETMPKTLSETKANFPDKLEELVEVEFDEK